MKRFWCLLPVLIAVLYLSCKPHRRGLPFNTVKGIRFTEAKRIFDNGLVFDKQGYQLEPLYKLYFLSDDSVMVFSPKTKKYYGFHVYFDHDSIFNMVNNWLKVKKISRDSLVFQALRVEDKVILDDDEGSKVYITFYSDTYLKSGRIKNIKSLGMPGRQDTLFIQARAKLAHNNLDSAFAARQPAILKSKSGLVKVDKVVNESTPFTKIEAYEDYMSPEYNITINKAYENFDYSFSVFVDDKGQMHFKRSVVQYPPEYEKTYTGIMKGIIDGYLKYYVDVSPGKTLGIPHTSIIMLNVTGKK